MNTAGRETEQERLIREIEASMLYELIETPRPSSAQRRHDLETAIGTFEEALLDWIDEA